MPRRKRHRVAAVASPVGQAAVVEAADRGNCGEETPHRDQFSVLSHRTGLERD